MSLPQDWVVARDDITGARVGRLVDRVGREMGATVICLVCMDDARRVFIAPKPGCERDVLRQLGAINWDGAQRKFEEWVV